jgi:small basic protein (TIGR04137 family)
MSLDRSLKGANALVRHRNVLSRAERIERLKADGRWKLGDKATGSIFNLPKVRNIKLT